MIGAHLKDIEARHRLVRKIFFGKRGELRQHYREGMEDQLGALVLALKAVVLFNTTFILLPLIAGRSTNAGHLEAACCPDRLPRRKRQGRSSQGIKLDA
jgi:hypothetical protein